MKLRLMTLAAIAGLAVSSASATVTTFASWSPSGTNNIAFVNSGTGGNGSTYRSNGLGGTLRTSATNGNTNPTGTTPTNIAGTFKFLNPALAPYFTDVASLFSLVAIAPPPSQVGLGAVGHTNVSGNFSITYNGNSFLLPSGSSGIKVCGTTVANFGAAGACDGITKSNLLTGSFTGGTLAGTVNSTSGNLGVSLGGGGTIMFSSDFLVFQNNPQDLDINFGLTGVISNVSNANRGFNRQGTNGLRSFRGTTNAQFSADPAPLPVLAPEPATWGMMILGFGLVGLARRRRAATVAA